MKAKKKGLIRAVAVRAILAGKSTEQVIAAVRRAFPKAKASATPAGVNWYRADLKRKGVRVPEPKRAARKRAAA